MAKPAATIRAAIQQVYPGASVVARAQRALLFQHPSALNRYIFLGSLGPIHVAGTEIEIDTDWIPTTGAFQWGISQADYQIGARSVMNVGPAEYRQGEQFFTFQPNNLNWIDIVNGQVGSQALISSGAAVTASVVNDDVLRYTNGYGVGRHLELHAEPGRVRKVLVLDAPITTPVPVGSTSVWLELNFAIGLGGGIRLYLDGNEWLKPNNTRIKTTERIEVRAGDGVTVLWYLEKPRAIDANANEIFGEYEVRRQGSVTSLFITTRFPKTWLDSATYPVRIDPTFGPASLAGSAADAHENDNNAQFGVVNATVIVNSSTASGSRFNGGLHYANVTIPAGSTINAATLGNVRAFNTSNDDPNVQIHCEAADSPGDFSANADVTMRARTTAFTQWTATAILTNPVTTPDFTSAVQEVINRGGWASGNNLVVLVCGKSDSNSSFQFRSYDHSTGTTAAQLTIVYTAPSGAIQPPRTMHQARMRRAA